MEATLSLERKRAERNTSIDFSQCVICQCLISPHSNAHASQLSNATEAGLNQLTEKVNERQKYNDDVFIEFYDRTQHNDIERLSSQLKWHRPCYSALTNVTNISRLRKRFNKTETNTSSEIDDGHESPNRHSIRTPVDWKKCMFCQRDQFGASLYNCQTMATSNKIIELSKRDSVMRYRLAGVHDLPAAEGKYHLTCYRTFERQMFKITDMEGESDENIMCFHNVMQELRRGLSKGEVYSLKTVWKRYCELLAEKVEHSKPGSYHGQNFKDRIRRYLQRDVEFVRPLNPHEPILVFPPFSTGAAIQLLNESSASQVSEDEEILSHSELEAVDIDTEILSWLYRVALKIRGDISETPGHNVIGGISMDNAEKVVPKSLYLLLRLICDKDFDDKDTDDTHPKILSIAQDIVYLSSGGKKKTPKHIGLGVTVHQATRSKKLVELLHAAGHSISYASVLQVDRSLVSDIVDQFEKNGKIFVPSNMIHGSLSGYIRYANDNIDIIEETLDGKGTFHASQSAMFTRRVKSTNELSVAIPFGTSRSVKIPAEIQQLQESHVSYQQPEPIFVMPVELASFEPDQQETRKAEHLDMAWLLTRSAHSTNQTIPAWSGFNQTLDVSGKEIEVSNIGYLPLINAPAHEYDVIWTVLKRCMATTAHLGQEYTIVTFDEQLYSKAKILQWLKPQECNKLVIMLGGFHTQMNFAKAIGQHMADSGLKDIWVDTGVFGDTTSERILQGKSWNRTIRAHKLTLEALWRCFWPAFEEWMNTNGMPIDPTITVIIKRIGTGFYHKDVEQITENTTALLLLLEEIHSHISEFDRFKEDNPTYTFWRQYMEMVSVLMRFTRALRVGNWKLFLSSLAEMLPWFSLYNHTNYIRWGTVFLADAAQLESHAPVVFNGFMKGDFVVKETHHQFNMIPDDQGLEHINKIGKIAGGLIGITRTEGALERWSLAYNERSQLAKCTWTMFGMKPDDMDDHEFDHKDLGSSRLARDEEDVKKLMNEFQSHKVFTCESAALVSITTGDVATADISNYLIAAPSTAKELHQEFVKERLVEKKTSFYKVLHKNKVKTFASLFEISVNVEKNKKTQVKADRELFQRLAVAVESGRDVHLDDILHKELSPVPLALANTDGSLRTSNKSQLGQLLERGNAEVCLPASETKECTIIDGMGLVHVIGKPAECKTFGDLADTIAQSICAHFSATCTRVDILFDQYRALSIKSGTRTKRRRGMRPILRLIDDRNVKLPDNWQNYLALEDNKNNLVNFLSTQLSMVVPETGCELVVSGGFLDCKDISTSNGNHDVSCLSSTQEEADTRIILHAHEASHCGYERIIIVARDTDVLVLLVAFRNDFHGVDVWLKSGTNRKPKFIAVHKIELPDCVRSSLIAFHSLTGTDTTSQFSGIGKITAWKVLCANENAKLLHNLGDEPLISPVVQSDVERFVCRLYKLSSPIDNIQLLRSAMFRTCKKSLESLPPTRDALLLHISRANFQAFIWHNALVAQPTLPSPEMCGWKLENGRLNPILMEQDAVSREYLQVTTCGCSESGSQCSNRQCRCMKSDLRCTSACACTNYLAAGMGWCQNPYNYVPNDDDGDDVDGYPV